jgi:hypothetical protein
MIRDIIKIFTILFLFSLSYCSNPIEKKKKELKNLKIKLSEVHIKKYNMILLPPLPKIHFEVMLDVENGNEDTITIEKFNFKILTNYEKKENMILGIAKSPEEYELLPKEKRVISVSVVTSLEDNPDKKVYEFVGEILKSLLLNKEMEFLLEGSVEYNTFLGKINIPISEVFKTRARP